MSFQTFFTQTIKTTESGGWGGGGGCRRTREGHLCCVLVCGAALEGDQRWKPQTGDDFELRTSASTTACDHRCAQRVNLHPPTRAKQNTRARGHSRTHAHTHKEKATFAFGHPYSEAHPLTGIQPRSVPLPVTLSWSDLWENVTFPSTRSSARGFFLYEKEDSFGYAALSGPRSQAAARSYPPLNLQPENRTLNPSSGLITGRFQCCDILGTPAPVFWHVISPKPSPRLPFISS